MCSNNLMKIVTCAFVLLFVLSDGIIGSLVGPFLPTEFAKKGVSKTVTGFVIGFFDLSMIVYSVLLPKYTTFFNLKTYVCYGAGLEGTGTILIGMTTFLNCEWILVTANLFLRSITSMGCAYLWFVGPPYLFPLFPEYRARIFSLFQLSSFVGFSLGPVIGSALYVLGGFLYPFLFIGLFEVTLLVLGAFIMLPHQRNTSPATNEKDFDEVESEEEDTQNAEAQLNPLLLLKNVNLLVISFAYMWPSVLNGAISIFLGAYLKEVFNMDQKWIGFHFSVIAVSSAVVAPLVGLLTDKGFKWLLFNANPVAGIAGCLLMIMFIVNENLHNNILLCLSMCLLGCCGITNLVSGFLVLSDVISKHYSHVDITQQQTMLSAWSHLTTTFGQFLGRGLIGGVIYEFMGLLNVLIILVVLLSISSFVAIIFWCRFTPANPIIIVTI